MYSNNIPFRRESFADKELLIPFDANFNRLNEEGMRSQYVGKNISELRTSIDSLSRRVDSIGNRTAEGFTTLAFPTLAPAMGQKVEVKYEGGKKIAEQKKETDKKVVNPVSLDSLLLALSPAQRDQVFSGAFALQSQRKSEQEFRAVRPGQDLDLALNAVRADDLARFQKTFVHGNFS